MQTCKKPELGAEIRCIQRMIHHRVEKFRMESGNTLTLVQMRTLGFLLISPDQELYQKDVERELNIRRSTATELLNVLERDGYLRREVVVSDKRLKRLIPTQKAKDLGMRIFQDMQNMEKLLSKDIAQEDLEVFYRVTAQMKRNLKGEGEYDSTFASGSETV